MNSSRSNGLRFAEKEKATPCAKAPSSAPAERRLEVVMITGNTEEAVLLARSRLDCVI